jgi:hypothetical protein
MVYVSSCLKKKQQKTDLYFNFGILLKRQVRKAKQKQPCLKNA